MSAARLRAALVAALLLAFTPAAWAQTQVVIPWPAGGGTDIIGRLVQAVLAENLRTPVVIRNVGGATGTIGTTEVVRARPDGTMLLLTSMAPIAIQPSFLARPPYRVDQLAPICLVAEAPATLMTPRATGLRTVADIAERARARPGELPFASGGVGGLGHLAMVGLMRSLDIDMNHIPFRGSGDAMVAMLGGNVLMLTAEANLVRQYELHAIGVFAEQRSPDMPDTPTMREQGLDLVFPLWTGMFAPAGTPAEVLDRLDAACRHTMADPRVVEGMTRAAHPVRYLNRAEFTDYVRSQAARYAQLIAAAGLRQAD